MNYRHRNRLPQPFLQGWLHEATATTQFWPLRESSVAEQLRKGLRQTPVIQQAVHPARSESRRSVSLASIGSLMHWYPDLDAFLWLLRWPNMFVGIFHSAFQSQGVLYRGRKIRRCDRNRHAV